MDHEQFKAAAPTQFIEPDAEVPVPHPGIALCLSGGGYRATLFHLGAVWAIKRANLLSQLQRVSSASGGSILAALLGLKWDTLVAEGATGDEAFLREIVTPIAALTSKTIDVAAATLRLLRLHSVHDPIVHSLEQDLYNGATLQNLPDHPRFVINATNVQSGALWRFMKPRMRDWRVGDIESPRVPLSHAVAASAAFPPFLSPFKLSVRPEDFAPGSGRDLSNNRFRRFVMLTDAGVYDNLALETSWKKYETLLVSDAGWPLPPDAKPSTLWVGHTRRAIDILTHSIARIRQDQLISSFKEKRRNPSGNSPLARSGAYWSIRSRPEAFGMREFFIQDELHLAKIQKYPTRLSKVPEEDRNLLIDWGFLTAKLAMQRYMNVHFPMNPYYGSCSVRPGS